jgi:hypothetical protein
MLWSRSNREGLATAVAAKRLRSSESMQNPSMTKQ